MMATREPREADNAEPAFRSQKFLLQHARECLDFYTRDAAVDKVHGGMHQCFRDDGSVFDRTSRHLVSSARLVVQFAWAVLQFPAERDRFWPFLQTTLGFLRRSHLVPTTGGYKWTLDLDDPSKDDATNRCYGVAFALLAYSTAVQAGVKEAREWINETWDTLSARFWEETHGLYADEATADWSSLSPYRGQNANMHACEAHMAAFDATGDERHLFRARRIAHGLCVRLAAKVKECTGHELVYEHYSTGWSGPDLEYNKDKPDDTFRPWGFQPGHLVEWAKLLVQLQRYTHVPSERSATVDRGAPTVFSGGYHATTGAASAVGEPEHEQSWRIPTAQHFFDAAVKGWDEEHGGFVYSLAPQPDLPQSNKGKYYWVQAEGIAATALLAAAVSRGKRGSSSDRGTPVERDEGSGERGASFYMDWFDRIWRYSWRHFIDHVYGGWYRILTPANAKVDDQKSPPGKVDYHSCGACYEAARALQDMDFR